MVKKIIITLIFVLTVVALSVFTCFGWTVIRVQVYGVEYGVETSPSTHRLNYVLSSGGGEGYRIGVYSPSSTITGISYITFYFFVDTDTISSFYITLHQSGLPYAAGLSSYGVSLYKMAADMSLSGTLNIRASTDQMTTKISDSEGDYSWFYQPGTAVSDKNVISVTIPLGSAVIGTTIVYWDVIDFTVNGVPVSDIKAYKNYELLDSVSQGMDIGLVPDPSAIITSTNNVVGYYSDIGPVMLDTYMNNTLIAPMLIITFTVGAAAYILFGKKA